REARREERRRCGGKLEAAGWLHGAAGPSPLRRAVDLQRNEVIVPAGREAGLFFVPVHVPADIQERDAAVNAAHAMRQVRWNELDVAGLQRARFPADDLAVDDLPAGRQRAAAFELDPDI